MRGADDFDPLRGGQFALGENPAHLVVEDLCGSSRDRVQTRFPQADQPFPNTHTALGHSVGDLHRRKRVHVHGGHLRLHRTHQFGVAGHRQLRVDTTLHTDLGRACDVCLPCPICHLLRRQREGIRVALTLREGAEPAAGVADIGEVDIAVDHECDVIADGILAERICQCGNGIQRRTIGSGQSQIFRVTTGGWITLSGAQCGGHIGVNALGSAGRQLTNPVTDGFPVTESTSEITAALGPPSLGVDRSVQIDAAQRLGGFIRFLPRPPRRIDIQGESGFRVGQCGQVPGHPRIDPGRTGGHVLRLGGEPLHQVETGLCGDLGEILQRGPRTLRVDVIRCQRGNATPIVHTRAQ